jgi:glutathione synthase
MDYAFILDPLPDLKAYKDSSVSMMRSLAARGHAIFALQPSDVFWDASGTRARVAPLVLKPDDHDWYEAGVPENRALKDFAAVLMRKDPFDMEYLY